MAEKLYTCYGTLHPEYILSLSKGAQRIEGAEFHNGGLKKALVIVNQSLF